MKITIKIFADLTHEQQQKIVKLLDDNITTQFMIEELKK